MSWNNIKLDLADKTFSRYIRLRDKRCVACYKRGTGPDGIIGLQCSHYWSRRNENTRFDPQNTDTLCPNCHRRWGGDYRREYEAFKINQLGQKGYDLLMLRAHTYVKRDRKMSYLIAKELLKTLE